METPVILEGARTPIGRFLGSYAELPAVDLGVLAAKEAMATIPAKRTRERMRPPGGSLASRQFRRGSGADG